MVKKHRQKVVALALISAYGDSIILKYLTCKIDNFYLPANHY